MSRVWQWWTSPCSLEVICFIRSLRCFQLWAGSQGWIRQSTDLIWLLPQSQGCLLSLCFSLTGTPRTSRAKGRPSKSNSKRACLASSRDGIPNFPSLYGMCRSWRCLGGATQRRSQQGVAWASLKAQNLISDFSLHLLNRVLSWFKEEICFFHCPRLFILCHLALQGNPGFPGAPAMGVTMSGLQPFLCHTASPTVVPVDQRPRDASHWSVGWTKGLYPWPSNQPCLLLPCSISFFLPLCYICPLASQRSRRIKLLPCSSLCSGLVPLFMLLWFLLKRHCWCLFF